MKKSWLARWRNNFVTGLAVILPGLLSVIVIMWLFRTVASVTDTLLIFLPRDWTHAEQGKGPLLWHFSLLAFVVSVLIICAIGKMARIYIGVKIIQFTDHLLLKTPLVNKIYGTIKQVNEAFSSGSRSSFKQVVLVEYPRAGIYSMGFLTGEQLSGVTGEQAGLPDNLISVFIPTTPNPTGGFVILVPEHTVRKLDLSVADGIKFIISLGAIAPEQQQAQLAKLPR